MLKQRVKQIAAMTLMSLAIASVYDGAVVYGEDAPLNFGKAKQPKTIVKPKATKKTAKPYRKPKLIELQVKPGQDPNDVWNDYFLKQGKKEVPAQDVRETVRVLMKKQKYNEASALIQAALRNNHVKRWMYQALATAMYAANQPDSEVERALMSAVDWTGDNPLHLMKLARSMSHFGFDARAIEILKQVSELEPTNPLPYVEAMNLAVKTKNLPAIKWSTLEIISKGWPKQIRKIEEEAVQIAQATIAELSKKGKKKEAREFKKELALAQFRDLIIKVSWTGNADVDMMIEEPTGTVCSFRNPRTIAGGVMLGDSFASLGSDAPDGFSESYVCPKAFKGEYKLRLRRVWGKVTGGKVKVEVISRYEKKNKIGERLTYRIELKESDSIVNINFKNGRRKKELTELQVKNVMNNQLAMGRQILAQQLGTLNNPGVQNALANARTGINNNNGFNPFIRRGAVGFRPVITTLPEGANMAATAVMSADRRYVRITAIPIFSQIGKVLTFNIISGEIGDGDPDFDDDDGGGVMDGAVP